MTDPVEQNVRGRWSRMVLASHRLNPEYTDKLCPLVSDAVCIDVLAGLGLLFRGSRILVGHRLDTVRELVSTAAREEVSR